MFKKSIKLTDSAALIEAIESIRGKATAWTMDAYDVKKAAADAEARLDDLGVYKKDRVGATATVSSGGPSSKSYKYSVTGSVAELRRFPEGWRLVSYERSDMYPGEAAKATVTLPHDLREKLAARFFAARGIAFTKPEVSPSPVAHLRPNFEYRDGWAQVQAAA